MRPAVLTNQAAEYRPGWALVFRANTAHLTITKRAVVGRLCPAGHRHPITETTCPQVTKETR